MRIDGLGTPGLPVSPLAGGSTAAAAQANASGNNAMLLAIQEEEKKGGGGGGGHGGHGVKKGALDSIDDIAARNSLNIETRKKTVLDRMREIETMKAQLAEEGESKDDAGEDTGDGERNDPENSASE